MKAIKQIVGTVAVGCVLALSTTPCIQAQDQKSRPGTYYSAKDFEWKPPMPFNPHPELQAVEIEPGVFLIDDTMIPDTPEQAAARKQWEEADALAKAIAADPLLAAAAKQAAAEAERVAKEALQKRIHEEFVPWLHVEAKLADGTQTTFARQLQDRLAETKNEIARLAAQNAAELEAGREQAAAIGLMDMGTNQLGGVLSLVGTGDGLGFITSFNTEAADTISTDELQPGGNTSLALTGTNTVIGVWEAGRVFTNHLEFTNGGRRVFELETTNRYSVTDHATHVTGTLVGRGVTNAARGMAFQATAHTWDAFDDTTEMLSEATTNAIRVSNHSYGRGCGWAGVVFDTGGNPYYLWAGDVAISTTGDYNYGFYNVSSANIDSDVYLAQHYLPVWAAANERGPQGQAPSTNAFVHAAFVNGVLQLVLAAHPHDYTLRGGYDLLPPQQSCKNGLTVGAVSNIVGGYSGSNSVIMSTFSSFGPTDDGRIKPDVVAGGVNIFSTGSASNTHYYTDSGTSMAAPAVAGSLDLLVGRQNQLYGTNRPMLASTLRGLAIHTADEAGPAAGPDYRFGWGLFNARSAALLIESNYISQSLAHIKEVRLLSGDYIEFPVVATNNQPLRVGVYWTDPPGTPVSPSLNPTNRMLVNDIDIRVVSPGGVTNFPWVLNPAAVTNAATPGDNFRDNAERVDIAVPVNGTYLVRVAHKGNLVNNSNVVSEQWVTVLVQGNVAQPQPDLVLEPPVIDGTNAYLKWPSVVGRIYRVEYNDDLTTSSWTDATGEISATKTNVSLTISASSAQRFYRVAQVR
jgi:hypothetical protein